MYEKSFYMKKLPPAFTTALTQCLNCFQILAMVALGRMAITSILLAISKAGVLGGLF
jgi:hypothetical protein